MSAERDVRPPLAGRGDASDRADDGAASDDHAQVVAARRHDLLDKRAVPAEPRAATDRYEVAHELLGGVTADDVPSPAAEARLDDDRRVERARDAVDDVRGSRV